MRNNIIRVTFSGSTFCRATTPLYQFDYGQILQIAGVDLPAAYEVHFSSAPHGVATTAIGGPDGVEIPDAYLTSGSNIYAWIFLHTGEDDGETEYSITIPVNRRASVSDQPPTPVQQDVITQTIAAANAAKTAAETAQGAAETAQGKAEDAQEAAETAQGKAEDAQEAAEDAQEAAEAAQAAAEAAVAHNPMIQNGTWWVWDPNQQEYVDTHVPASGTTTYTDLSDKPQINSVTLTGNKSLHDLGAASEAAVAAKYTKPSGGIPDTDLSSGVQTSLGKADTAYQKPSGGIPATDIASGVIPDVSGFYTKPSGGIPDTDLSSGVQTSLGKADTAYQKPSGGIPGTDIASGVIPAVDNTLTTTGAAADAKKTGDEIADVKSQIEKSPTVKPTDASNVDLDITDKRGNVLLRLKNGHIQTKNFDSAVDSAKVVSTTAGSDLDITDDNFNVIGRFKDGHIKTKYFNSQRETARCRMQFGAHNGAEYYAPECTIPAYRIAGQQGWEWAWVAGIDFSTEGTMYVIHDDTVDRTTDGTGYLNQMTDAQINALNITQTGRGYNLSDFDPAELKIPTFEQVLQQCVRYGMKMVLRLHMFPGSYSTVEEKTKWDGLVNLLKSYNVDSDDISCYVGMGATATICRTLFGENTEISTFLGSSGTAQDYIDWFESKAINGKRAAIININQLDLAAVKLLHTNGIRVYAYDSALVSDAENCAMWGVDIFQNSKTYFIPN